MKIVVDALQVPPAYTGVGRQVLEIGSQLHDLPTGLELRLRCAADTAAVLGAAFPPGTTVETPIRSARPRLRRIALQQLLQPLRDDPDTLLVCLGDQAPLFGRATRLLVVNDVRRLASGGGSADEAYYRWLVPRAARRSDHLATISRFSRDELRRLTGLEATVVAHHPAPRASAPAPAGSHLLVVGALRRYKGIETAIAAIGRLAPAARRPLVAVGPTLGRGDELIAQAAAAGVVLELRGWVPELELERLYAEAYAVVCPSTYEGYGLPVAEALARGQAVVASDIPPHREIGSEACLWFVAADAASLAAALERLPTLRDDLAAAAVERIRELQDERPTWRDLIIEISTPRAA